jgi:hypothetical protein
MKLIKFNHQEDYGHDWYVRLLSTKRWAFFQGSVSWCEYPGWPYLQIKFGMGSLICILFQANKFGLSIGLFERTWKL